MTDPAHAYTADLSAAHDELDRYLKQDGASVFSQPAWNPHPPQFSGNTTVDKLLDAGVAGHEWFLRALIRYHRVATSTHLPGFGPIDIPPLHINGAVAVEATSIDVAADPKATMRRLQSTYYDQQRGINLDSMRHLAAKLKTAAEGSLDNATDLENVAGALPEVWQGAAATAAFDHLAGLHTHTSAQTQYLHDVAAVLGEVPDTIAHIVQGKAEFMASFDTPQLPVAGHGMRLGSGSTDGAHDPVSIIITVVLQQESRNAMVKDLRTAAEQMHQPDPTKDERKVEDWKDFWAVDFGGNYRWCPGDVRYEPSPAGRAVIQACEKWLGLFARAVRAAFTAYVHQCGLADYYIKQTYKPVLDLLKNPGPDTPSAVPPPQWPLGGHNPPTSPPSPAPSPGPLARPPDHSPHLPPPPDTQNPDTTPAASAPTTPTPHTDQASPAPTPGGTPTTPLTGLISGATNALGSAVGHLTPLADKALDSSRSQSRDTPHDAHSPDPSGPSRSAPPPSDHHEPHPAAGPPPPPTQPPTPPLVDVDIPGGHITAQRNSNGLITVTFFDPGGHGQQYTLGINKDGLPFITPQQPPPAPAPHPLPAPPHHPPPAHPSSADADSPSPHERSSHPGPPPAPDPPPAPEYPAPTDDTTAPSADHDPTATTPHHQPPDAVTAAAPLVAGGAALGKGIGGGERESTKPRPYHRRIPPPPPPDTSLIAPTEGWTVTHHTDTPPPPGGLKSQRKTTTDTET